MLRNKYYPLILTGLVLLIDQAFKLIVKTQMFIGQEFDVIGSWFRIHFIENNGMAFGMELGGSIGKLALTLFRVVAVYFIGKFMLRLHNENAPKGAVTFLTLIFAGAIGNILDSVFYGLIFKYETIFFGRVVDMLYFPIWSGILPDWIPFKGGDYFEFFQPVFNIADASIFIGVVGLLLFHRDILVDKTEEPILESE